MHHKNHKDDIWYLDYTEESKDDIWYLDYTEEKLSTILKVVNNFESCRQFWKLSTFFEVVDNFDQWILHCEIFVHLTQKSHVTNLEVIALPTIFDTTSRTTNAVDDKCGGRRMR